MTMGGCACHSTLCYFLFLCLFAIFLTFFFFFFFFFLFHISFCDSIIFSVTDGLCCQLCPTDFIPPAQSWLPEDNGGSPLGVDKTQWNYDFAAGDASAFDKEVAGEGPPAKKVSMLLLETETKQKTKTKLKNQCLKNRKGDSLTCEL